MKSCHGDLKKQLSHFSLTVRRRRTAFGREHTRMGTRKTCIYFERNVRASRGAKGCSGKHS